MLSVRLAPLEVNKLTSEKLISVFEFYRDELAKKGIAAEQLKDEDYHAKASDLLVSTHLGHVAWMCDAAIGFVQEDRIEKAMRWLGYVQGVLYIAGEYTLDDLKNHSRPDSVRETT
jgi:hypothetical protein